MSMRVHHLALKVSDLDRAEAFYAGVLGLPVVRRWDDEGGRPRSVWLGLGEEAFLAVERAEDPDAVGRSDEAPGFHVVALAIPLETRDQWRQRLAAAGHAVERESPFSLYVRDPEGNLVALSHWPDPAPEAGSGPR